MICLGNPRWKTAMVTEELMAFEKRSIVVGAPLSAKKVIG